MAEAFFENAALLAIVRQCVALLRISDYRCAQKIDHFIAISNCVQERIRRCYQRDSQVIHPPVDVQRFDIKTETDDYYLVLSRLVGTSLTIWRRLVRSPSRHSAVTKKFGNCSDPIPSVTIKSPSITCVASERRSSLSW